MRGMKRKFFTTLAIEEIYRVCASKNAKPLFEDKTCGYNMQQGFIQVSISFYVDKFVNGMVRCLKENDAFFAKSTTNSSGQQRIEVEYRYNISLVKRKRPSIMSSILRRLRKRPLSPFLVEMISLQPRSYESLLHNDDACCDAEQRLSSWINKYHSYTVNVPLHVFLGISLEDLNSILLNKKPLQEIIKKYRQ